jgi:hypothetical protein
VAERWQRFSNSSGADEMKKKAESGEALIRKTVADRRRQNLNNNNN